MEITDDPKMFLKWPNDLFVMATPPAKLAGILCESSPSWGTVVGFGINLSSHPEIEQNAKHLSSFLTKDHGDKLRTELLLALVQKFEELMRRYTEEGDMFKSWLIAQLQRKTMRPFLKLKEIKVHGKKVRPLEILNDGSLEVYDFELGKPMLLSSGVVDFS